MTRNYYFHKKKVICIRPEVKENDNIFKKQKNVTNLHLAIHWLNTKMAGGGQFDPDPPVVFRKLYLLKRG